MIYRICTENKNITEIEALLNSTVGGYSIFKGRGVWHGQSEDSLCIEIDFDGSRSSRNLIYKIANAIKIVNEQEAILVQEIKCKSKLI